jgi:hypothetical protein
MEISTGDIRIQSFVYVSVRVNFLRLYCYYACHVFNRKHKYFKLFA